MNVVTFPAANPKGRSVLVQYLRNLADEIEADNAETDPRAALIVLTGPTQHEVLHCGNDVEKGFISGALEAARAVYGTHYPTVGGNVRPRTHQYAGGPKRGGLVKIRTAATQAEGE